MSSDMASPFNCLLVYIECFASGVVPAKVARAGLATRAQLLGGRRRGEHPQQRGAEGGAVVRIDQEGGVADDLRQGGGIGADDGSATRHRLQRRQAETLVERGKREAVCCAVEGGNVCLGDRRADDRIGYAQLLCK